LETLDCEVCADACDGSEEFDLIKNICGSDITDIRMPGMDGWK
jgi:two-component system response regulator YesN